MLWRFLKKLKVVLLGEAHTDRNCPPWPGTIVTICMSCLQVVPVRNTELIILHQPEEFGKGQKETPHVRPPPRILLSGIHLAKQGVHPQERLWVRWLAKDNPETNPITVKPETASHVAEMFSWAPLPYWSPPVCPFPIKSLALPAHVSPQTIHFRVLDKSPVLGPGRGPPSCNITI